MNIPKLSNKCVLITNDDGINADGIYLLIKEIIKFTLDIYIVAPKTQQSAISHARTFFRGMSLDKKDNLFRDIEIKGCYALDGTPADCVRFAVAQLKIKPDLIISGVNDGENLGDDILYSGTCGAGFEACLLNIKSICFSCNGKDFSSIKEIPNTLEYIYTNNLDKYDILNVNLVSNPKGIIQTIQGKQPAFTCYFIEKDGLWYATGNEVIRTDSNNLNYDTTAWENGYISITPLTINRTDTSK